MNEVKPDKSEDRGPLHEEAGRIQHDLREKAKRLGMVASALGPIAKREAWEDLTKLESTLVTLQKKIASDLECADELPPFLDHASQWLKETRASVRRRLGRELKEACESKGLEFQVISRENPIEVRIPPFAVVIDFERGRAEFQFAKLPIDSCTATANDIIIGHARAREALEKRAVDPSMFFESCHRAWRAARGSRGDGEVRVEIPEFLPFLALELQSKRFRIEPTSGNYQGYTRAQFAWDVLRLRRAGRLSQNGVRMNLGVATGISASQKKRVVYFEDEHGNGEYKLTVFFTKQEEASE